MWDKKHSYQTRLQCITELIKLFNLPAKRGSKRAWRPWRIMVDTTGVREVRLDVVLVSRPGLTDAWFGGGIGRSAQC